MITSAEYIQLRAFARVDGAYLGILWIISFACYLAGLSTQLLGLIGTFLAIGSPIFAYLRLKKFRDYARHGIISFKRSMAYFILMFFYASLIFALAQYIYFAFIDDGYLLRSYISILSTPEAEQIIKAYGMTLKQMTENLNALSEISPIMIALNIMPINITVGIILSIPMALIACRSGNGNAQTDKNENKTIKEE